MSKNSNNNSGNQSEHDTQVRTIDPHAVEKQLDLDPNFQKIVEKLSQSNKKVSLGEEEKNNIQDLVRSVVNKNMTSRGTDKEGVAKIPLQLNEQDYTNLLNDVKKSRDVNRGSHDQSTQLTKQILNTFITTKAIERIKSVKVNKLLRAESNKLGRTESGDDKNYASLKTQRIINYLTHGQMGKAFKRIAGKALGVLTQRATGDIKEDERQKIDKKIKEQKHNLPGRF